MGAAPVIFLAAPFSGAARVCEALGAHPRLCALPQLNVFMADNVAQLLDIHALSQAAHADGLLRAVAQLEFGAQDDQTIAWSRRWLAERADWTTQQLLEYLAARAAPRRLLLAETEAALRPMDLRRLARVPDALLVQVVRHPYAQGLLHAQWLQGRLFVPPDYKDHSVQPARIEPQIGWLRANRNLENFAQGGARLLRVRFEDCMGEGAALAQLARAIGIEDSASAGASDFAGFGPSSAPYGLDDELLAEFSAATQEQAQRGTLESPLPWREGESFTADVSALARRYGYA